AIGLAAFEPQASLQRRIAAVAAELGSFSARANGELDEHGIEPVEEPAGENAGTAFHAQFETDREIVNRLRPPRPRGAVVGEPVDERLFLAAVEIPVAIIETENRRRL